MKATASKQDRFIVLVFGESFHDAKAIAHLVRVLCPPMKDKVRSRPRPISLSRDAAQSKVKAWTDQLRRVIDAYEERVVCVFVHRDADIPDLQGEVEQQLQASLRKAGIDQAHAIVPVEEIEAWWLLFPAATGKLKKSWSDTLKKQPGNVDMISNPKHELMQRTGRNAKKDAYTEADSSKVAERVAAAIQEGSVPSGQSNSYNRFKSSVDACCSRLGSS